MKSFSSFVLFLLVVVAATATLITAQQQPQQITKLWETNLSSSTQTGVNIPTWIDPQAAAFSFQENSYIAVTTADGSLNMLNASNGNKLWSLFQGTSSGQLQRSCGGNYNGLFVGQNGLIIAVHPQTSRTLWTTPLNSVGFGADAHIYVHNDMILVNDASSLAAVSAVTGKVIWSRMNECNGGPGASGCSYHVDVVGGSGRVGYQTTINGASAVIVVDKNGDTVLKQSFPDLKRPFFANVDSTSFTLINLNSPIKVVRYPQFSITNFTNANNGESITGYSLSCISGGATCGGQGFKDGYQTLFINTNYATYSFDFTTGERIAVSLPHPNIHFHLVAFAQEVSISQAIGEATMVHTYNWKTMESYDNFTMYGTSPYNLRVNWYNEMVMPTFSGFYFYFAKTRYLIEDKTNAYPQGLVEQNIIIQQDRFYFSSGNSVVCYSFPPSGHLNNK